MKEGVNAIQIGRILYDSSSDQFTSQEKQISEIPAELTPFTPQNRFNNKTVETKVFPDSGASASIAGPHYLKLLNIPEHHLIPTQKSIVAVGGTQLKCFGWVPIKFSIGGHITRQPLYICDKVDKLYLSRSACVDTKILPETFPFPMDWNSEEVASINNETENNTLAIPSRPSKIPFAPTTENIP
jgi:hypothetical protein